MITKRGKKGRKGQEEIVGFAIIIIIVAVVILFLLSFSLRSSGKEEVESFEVDSFLQSSLQYTTECEVGSKNLSLQNLIFECVDGDASSTCSDDRNSCEVLTSTFEGIVGESWKVGLDRPVKGYGLVVKGNNDTLVSLNEGNVTKNFKGGLQDLARGSDSIQITLKVYY